MSTTVRTVGVAILATVAGCQLDTTGLGTTAAASIGGDTTVGSGATSSGGPDGMTITGADGTGGSTVGNPMGTSDGGDATETTEGDSSGGAVEPLPPPRPFGDATPVPGVNDGFAADDDPTLRQDMLELYFASTRYGSEDIFVTWRATVDTAWAVPSPVGQLNSISTETTPELSHDGLLLMFASDRLGDFEAFYSTRASTLDPWSIPQHLPPLGSASVESAFTPQADASTLMFCSAREPTEGGADMWRATIDRGTGTIADVARVLELSTTGIDCPGNSDATMTWFYYLSSGPGTAGGEDIRVVQHDPATGGFLTPYDVAELNTAYNDADPWVSGDADTIFFASDRSGSWDLYTARRSL